MMMLMRRIKAKHHEMETRQVRISKGGKITATFAVDGLTQRALLSSLIREGPGFSLP